MKQKVFWPDKFSYWFVILIQTSMLLAVIFYVLRNRLVTDISVPIIFLLVLSPGMIFMQKIEIDSVGLCGASDRFGLSGRRFIARSDIEIYPYEKTATTVGLVIRSKKSWEQIVVSRKTFKSSTIEEIKRLLQS